MKPETAKTVEKATEKFKIFLCVSSVFQAFPAQNGPEAECVIKTALSELVPVLLLCCASAFPATMTSLFFCSS